MRYAESKAETWIKCMSTVGVLGERAAMGADGQVGTNRDGKQAVSTASAVSMRMVPKSGVNLETISCAGLGA